MLQAARLNLKDKALRLAFVDDVAFTTRDLDVLRDISEKVRFTFIRCLDTRGREKILFSGSKLW